MRTFDELVTEADAAEVTGRGFGWPRGWAFQQRPPWGFAHLLAERLATVDRALHINTGGGEVVRTYGNTCEIIETAVRLLRN